jgi:hypothetical protein
MSSPRRAVAPPARRRMSRLFTESSDTSINSEALSRHHRDRDGLANSIRQDAHTKQRALPLNLGQPHLERVHFDGTHVVDLVLRSLGHNRTESFSRVPHRLVERRAGDGARREIASKVTGAEEPRKHNAGQGMLLPGSGLSDRGWSAGLLGAGLLGGGGHSREGDGHRNTDGVDQEQGAARAPVHSGHKLHERAAQGSAPSQGGKGAGQSGAGQSGPVHTHPEVAALVGEEAGLGLHLGLVIDLRLGHRLLLERRRWLAHWLHAVGR